MNQPTASAATRTSASRHFTPAMLAQVLVITLASMNGNQEVKTPYGVKIAGSLKSPSSNEPTVHGPYYVISPERPNSLCVLDGSGNPQQQQPDLFIETNIPTIATVLKDVGAKLGFEVTMDGVSPTQSRILPELANTTIKVYGDNRGDRLQNVKVSSVTAYGTSQNQIYVAKSSEHPDQLFLLAGRDQPKTGTFGRIGTDNLAKILHDEGKHNGVTVRVLNVA